jgi:hypothetical protein
LIRATRTIRGLGVLAALPATVALAAPPATVLASAQAGYSVSVLVSSSTLSHVVGTTTAALTNPDDITAMDGRLFVAFQNGVGAQGEPSSTGNLDSTIVELTHAGRALHQWDVAGKIDGFIADPSNHRIITTVNEDGSSSLDTVGPEANRVVHYAYNKPLPHFGGTDGVAIYHGMILVSASAPGSTGGPSAPSRTYPAVYAVTLHPATGVASVYRVFGDESVAIVANTNSARHGRSVRLALTDPDSNAVVPSSSPRFAGSFVLNSQGDLEQVYVRNAGAWNQSLSVLQLSQSVDDTTWATRKDATLFATDSAHDTVDALHGDFWNGEAIAAVTPCNANSAPSTCPAPGYPENYLGSINLSTGQVSRLARFHGPELEPTGLTEG